MKRKTIRRLWISLAAVTGIVLAVAVICLNLLYGTPEWYQPQAMTAEQREAAAQRATSKLAMVQNVAAQVRADERAALRDSSTAPAPGSITVSFTDDEINAFFEKWSAWQSVRASYQRFLIDPRIVLRTGRMILAGRLKDIDAVASLHFEPRIDPQGRLSLKLAKIQGGKLPLPEATIRQYQHRAADAVQRRMPLWRRQASIDPTGVANSSAISAAMGQLLIDVLNDRSSEPVLFLPLVEKGSIPVRLTEVRIDDHALTLTVQPMTPPQRAELLEKIRDGSAQAAGR